MELLKPSLEFMVLHYEDGHNEYIDKETAKFLVTIINSSYEFFLSLASLTRNTFEAKESKNENKIIN